MTIEQFVARLASRGQLRSPAIPSHTADSETGFD